MPRGSLEPPIRAPLVAALLRFARTRGVDTEALALRAGLDGDLLADDEPLVAPRAVIELLDTVVAMLGDPSLALRLPRELTFTRYRAAEIVTFAQATVGEVLGSMACHASGWMPGTNGTVASDAARMCIRFATPGSPRGLGRAAHEYLLASALTLARTTSGVAIACERVWFANARPRDIAPLTEFFGTGEIGFGAADSGFAIAHNDAERPSQRADARLIATLASQAERDRQALESASSFARHVARALEATLPRVDIESVARGLRVSVRTLQRRLDDEGARFSEILDGVRDALARRWLLDETRTIADVAEALAFADLASFGRAFKRWTGTTPAAYRAEHAAKT